MRSLRIFETAFFRSCMENGFAISRHFLFSATSLNAGNRSDPDVSFYDSFRVFSSPAQASPLSWCSIFKGTHFHLRGERERCLKRRSTRRRNTQERTHIQQPSATLFSVCSWHKMAIHGSSGLNCANVERGAVGKGERARSNHLERRSSHIARRNVT